MVQKTLMQLLAAKQKRGDPLLNGPELHPLWGHHLHPAALGFFGHLKHPQNFPEVQGLDGVLIGHHQHMVILKRSGKKGGRWGHMGSNKNPEFGLKRGDSGRV